MSDFKIAVASVTDRERLVVEIWYQDSLIAELNQETENMQIAFYLETKTAFDLMEFLKILEVAKDELLNNQL